jgi:arylsulfatase B
MMAVWLMGCREGDPSFPLPLEEAPPENILLVLLDDIGVDKVGAYGDLRAPRTPVLDALAAEGMMFRHAYASPLCSPTRANVMTGRHARRTGVGHLVSLRHELPLSPDEIGLGELLAYSPWSWETSAVGKWHLGSTLEGDVLNHPASMGFDWYAGSLENLQVSLSGSGLHYQHWEKDTNGTLAVMQRYATLDTTDDALRRAHAMQEPWLLYVAYNASHKPFHWPPAQLHTYDEEPDYEGASPFVRQHAAMTESVDRELGRLLAGLPPEVRQRTTVIVMADNGSEGQVILPSHDLARHKGTAYEGGVRVPLIVRGPRVAQPGSESRALVHAVDLFATVADIAGVPLQGPSAPPLLGPVDGASLLPLLADPDSLGERTFVLSEKFRPNGPGPEGSSTRMIRDRDWKLIRSVKDGEITDELFRMVPGAWDEGPGLLADGEDLTEARQHERLAAALERQLLAMME